MKVKITALALLVAALLLASGPAFADGSTLQGDQVAQFSDFDEVWSDSGHEVDQDAPKGPLVHDPLENWNRIWFYYNDAFYWGVAKPVAEAYAWAVPEPPRKCVSNFFTNLWAPVRFVNNILQGKFDAAYMEFSKFLANTSWGLLGVFDVTEGRPRNWMPELPTADGMGQTLGKAGIGHGVYLVWPFIGPSSIRETVGWVSDSYMDPITYGDFTFVEFMVIRGYKNLNQLSLELRGNEYETLTEGAIDPYTALRDAYIRYRAKKVQE